MHLAHIAAPRDHRTFQRTHRGLAIGIVGRQAGKGLGALIERILHDPVDLLFRSKAEKICPIGSDRGHVGECQDPDIGSLGDRGHGAYGLAEKRADQKFRPLVQEFVGRNSGTFRRSARVPRQQDDGTRSGIEKRHLRGLQHVLAEFGGRPAERQEQADAHLFGQILDHLLIEDERRLRPDDGLAVLTGHKRGGRQSGQGQG